MRYELEKIEGQRDTFVAKVEKFCTKPGYKCREEPTILLVDVRRVSDNKQMTDHIWFSAGKSWIDLAPGTIVKFDARVDSYVKGYYDNRQIDYRLKHPTKVSILNDPRRVDDKS
jgi:hypothetical protein